MVMAVAVLAAFVALGTAAYYIYTRSGGPKFVPNAMFYGDDGKGGPRPSGVGAIRVTMYGVPWCPHSKAAKKPWEEWMAANDGQTISGVKIACDTVNCEADEESEARCHAANVKGYPTVVAETPAGDSVIMDAKTTVAALNQFIAKVASSVSSGNPL
jgi:glutaredoxin